MSSVQGLWTGLLGTVVILLGSVGFAVAAATGPTPDWWPHRYAALLVVTFLVMAAWEFGAVRVHRRNFDWSHPRPLDAAARARVGARYAALAITLSLATVAYVVLSHYGLDMGGRPFQWASSWYAPWFGWFFPLAGAWLVLGLPYAVLCETRGTWAPEEDEMLRAWSGYRALAALKRPSREFWNAQRSFLVKFFFLPLMVVFLAGNAVNFEIAVRDLLLSPDPSLWSEVFQSRAFDAAFDGLFLLDVTLAVLGYATASRLLDTHVRSTDATASGWLVAVACYPPFAQVMDLYLGYGMSEHSWSASLSGHSFILVLVGAGILALTAIYTLATVAFGLRFSNMTHRGILTDGPYAWVRHPAYAAKTLMWWAVAVPFLRSPGDTIRLGLWTAIYVARALTEERHLERDPDYRAYQAQVRYRFIPGIW